MNALADLGFAHVKRNGSSGIVFEGSVRRMYVMGKEVARGTLDGEIPVREYFYHLRFLEDFPEITHWAFGDAWTQRVRIDEPFIRRQDEVIGRVRFASEEDSGVYIIERGYELSRSNEDGNVWYPTPVVQVPMPRFNSNPLNIPLRLLLAKAVLDGLEDNCPYGEWQFVTSVIPAETVSTVWVEDLPATYGFRLKGIGTNLRAALCDLQGLHG